MSTMIYKTVPPAVRNLREVWRRFEGDLNNRLSGEDKWREMNRYGVTYKVAFADSVLQIGHGRIGVLVVRFQLKVEDTFTDFLPRPVKIHLSSTGTPIYKFGDYELGKDSVVTLVAAQLTNGLNEQKGRR